MPAFSDRLLSYIKRVEEETGRRVSLEKDRYLGLPGMASGFVDDPSVIIVRLSPELGPGQLEQSVAHEITHGLLRHKKGFPRMILRRQPGEEEALSLSILSSMLEDIPVNKMAHAEGFPLLASNYLDTVRKEEEDIISGKYFSSMHANAQVRKRLMISRYITAWGFLEYFTLDTGSKKILKKFITSFESNCPEESEMALQIREIITQNDIFTSEGYGKVIKLCLKLWELGDLVELKVD